MIGLYVAIAISLIAVLWIWINHNRQLRRLRESIIELRSQVTRYESEIANLERSLKQQGQLLVQAKQTQAVHSKQQHTLEADLAQLKQQQNDLQTQLDKIETVPPAPPEPQQQTKKTPANPNLPGFEGLIESPKAKKVFELMALGEAHHDIARKCDLQVSEVLLIMGLKKFMGKTPHD